MRVGLFTDSFGIDQFARGSLLAKVTISCAIAAFNRSAGHQEIRDFCRQNSLRFIVQPPFGTGEYRQLLEELKSENQSRVVSIPTL